MTQPHTQTQTCPDCGVVNAAGAGRCWLCQLPVGGGTKPAAPQPVRTEARAQQTPTRLVRISIVLLVAVVVVMIGLFLEGPGLSIVFAILVTPVMVRIFSEEYPTTAPSAVGNFFIVLGMIVTIGVAATVACFATCLATLYSLDQSRSVDLETLFSISFAAGGMAGILAAIGTYLLLRRSHRSSSP